MEAALGEALGAEPKTLAIVSQEFERPAGTIAKNVDRAAQRIFAQRLATQRGQPVDSLAEIDGLHGEKDAALRRELQQ